MDNLHLESRLSFLVQEAFEYGQEIGHERERLYVREETLRARLQERIGKLNALVKKASTPNPDAPAV